MQSKVTRNTCKISRDGLRGACSGGCLYFPDDGQAARVAESHEELEVAVANLPVPAPIILSLHPLVCKLSVSFSLHAIQDDRHCVAALAM
jgi:hypothetical protein